MKVTGPAPTSAPAQRRSPLNQVRRQEPRRAAMLRCERRTVVGERHPGLPIGEVLERQVRGVAAVREGHHVLG
jgi:hypothetical protein